MSISTQITELNNNINDLKSIKQDIKKAINTDFNVITNEKLEDYADIIKNTFETYKDYIPFTETEQATEITVNDAMEYTKNKIKLFGNIEQNQYQGYNILNGIAGLNFASNYNANRSTTTDTITVTSTSTGQYACARAKFNGIENGETYSISIKATFDTNGLPRIRLGKNDFEVSHIIATPTATLNGNHYESSYTFTAEEDFDLAFSFYPSYSGSNTTTHTATFYDIMIEKGSIVHNYEPYVGGQSSPSSSYPQTIHNVSGNNQIKIQNNNVFDEIMELGTINITTGENVNSTMQLRSKNYIKVKPNTTYYFKTGTDSSIWMAVETYDQNKTFLQNLGSKLSFFTTPNNCEYIRFYLAGSYGTEYKNDIIISTIDTSYTTHQEQIKDFTLVEGQKMYEGDYLADDGIHHVYTEVTLDGSEDETLEINNNLSTTNYTAFMYNKSNIIKSPNETSINLYCNKLLRDSSNHRTSNKQNC